MGLVNALISFPDKTKQVTLILLVKVLPTASSGKATVMCLSDSHTFAPIEAVRTGRRGGRRRRAQSGGQETKGALEPSAQGVRFRMCLVC